MTDPLREALAALDRVAATLAELRDLRRNVTALAAAPLTCTCTDARRCDLCVARAQAGAP